MALECARCGHELDQGPPGTPCPKCGTAMRFTLLGDYTKERKSAEKAKVNQQQRPPGFKDRFGRWLAGVLAVHLLAAFMIGGALVFLSSRQMTLEQASKEHPTTTIVAVLGIPAIATFLGVTMACGQVYLAQLVGFAIGLTANVAILGERLLSPAPASWQEWVATPVIGAIVGFLSGYRITGPMFKEEAVAVASKDDEWKTAAKPAIREIDPGMNVRRQRAIYGAVVGILFPFIVPPIIGVFMSFMSGQPSVVNSKMRSLEFVFLLVALLFAGVTAGSGTTRGVRQGVYVGLLIFLIQFLTIGGSDWQLGLIRFLPSIAVAMIGGAIGQKVFPPTQIYTGPKFR